MGSRVDVLGCSNPEPVKFGVAIFGLAIISDTESTAKSSGCSVLKSIYSPGSGTITSVAADGSGNVFLTRGQVVYNIVKSTGKTVASYTLPGGASAQGVDIDREGNVYVASPTSHKIYKLDNSLTSVLAEYGNGVPSQELADTPVDLSAVSDGILVVEGAGQRAYKLDTGLSQKSEVIGNYRSPGSGNYSLNNSQAIRGNSKGIYINDAGNGRIMKYMPSAPLASAEMQYIQSTYYVHSGGKLLYENSGLGQDAALVYGPAGLVARIESPALGWQAGIRFYHADHLSSAKVLTDANGKVVSEFDYLPFGEERYASGEGKYRYAGKEPDTTGLYYFGARYYNPLTGRFISVDPNYDASSSPYAYAENNPLKFNDPSGRASAAAITSAYTHVPQPDASRVALTPAVSLEQLRGFNAVKKGEVIGLKGFNTLAGDRGSFFSNIDKSVYVSGKPIGVKEGSYLSQVPLVIDYSSDTLLAKNFEAFKNQWSSVLGKPHTAQDEIKALRKLSAHIAKTVPYDYSGQRGSMLAEKFPGGLLLGDAALGQFGDSKCGGWCREQSLVVKYEVDQLINLGYLTHFKNPTIMVDKVYYPSPFVQASNRPSSDVLHQYLLLASPWETAFILDPTWSYFGRWDYPGGPYYPYPPLQYWK